MDKATENPCERNCPQVVTRWLASQFELRAPAIIIWYPHKRSSASGFHECHTRTRMFAWYQAIRDAGFLGIYRGKNPGIRSYPGRLWWRPLQA